MVDLQIYHEKASLYQYFACCIYIPLIFFNLFGVGRERRLGEHPKLTKNNLQQQKQDQWHLKGRLMHALDRDRLPPPEVKSALQTKIKQQNTNY